MPPRRVRAPERPVTITLDGKAIVADAEASLASALVGAGHLELARSPKFHRPRGPSCMRGGCDGCLLRIDGLPNMMACGLPAREGARCERQNVMLSSKLDLLRATDWFFPDGMNHHEMFAGVPGVQGVMLAFARRVSGLGMLPDHVVPPRDPSRERARELACDVLVIGAGAAGLSVAAALARAKVKVLVVDEQRHAGGCLLYFPRGARLGAIDVDQARGRLIDEASSAGATLRLDTTLIGVLEGGQWLASHATEGLVRITARAHVVATGAHDGVPSFVGNDLPGVLSARAAGRLLRDGVLVGERPLVAGDGPFAEAFVSAARGAGARVERVALERIEGVRGLSRVRSARVRDGSTETKIECDAVVVDAPCAPAFELAREAGAELAHEDQGFRVVTDVRGAAGSALFAVGEVVGAPLDFDGFSRTARVACAAVLSALGGAS